MIKLFLLLISFNLCILQANEKVEYTLGINVENNDFRKIKDIRLGFQKIFADALNIYHKKLNLTFYESTEEIISDFTKSSKLDILAIKAIDYLKNQKEINNNSKKFFIIKDSIRDYKQYYLIANTSSNINSIKDIKNKILTSYFENNTIRIWLDKLSLESNKKSYKNLIKLEIKKRSESLAILDVYFKKSDFAIISRSAWEIMIELNPTLKKKIRIIKKSDEIFFFAVAFFKKSRTKELENTFNELTTIEKLKSKVQDILVLAKAHSIKFVQKDYLKEIELFYKEYLELKKRYNQ